MDAESLLGNLGRMLKSVEAAQSAALCRALVDARSVHVAGVGRSGLILRGFAMRLTELGLRVHVHGDSTTPAHGADDLLLVCSGSGATASLLVASEHALAHGGRLAVITSAVISPLARLAHEKVVLPPLLPGASTAPGSGALPGTAELFLPIRTLFEQACFLYLDGVAEALMDALGQTPQDVEARRANLD